MNIIVFINRLRWTEMIPGGQHGTADERQRPPPPPPAQQGAQQPPGPQSWAKHQLTAQPGPQQPLSAQQRPQQPPSPRDSKGSGKRGPGPQRGGHASTGGRDRGGQDGDMSQAQGGGGGGREDGAPRCVQSCRGGKACRYRAQGRCRYVHPDEKCPRCRTPGGHGQEKGKEGGGGGIGGGGRGRGRGGG